MTDLAALLDTWQQWNAHNVMRRVAGQQIAGEPAVSALDALRDSRELIELLSGWQWQAIHAARCDGASWEAIAASMLVPVDQARASYTAMLDRLEQALGEDLASYRSVLWEP